MRKRTLSIVLAAAMCASLTACGGGGSTAETTAADSSNTETKAADASEKSDKPLRVCVVYTGNLRATMTPATWVHRKQLRISASSLRALRVPLLKSGKQTYFRLVMTATI